MSEGKKHKLAETETAGGGVEHKHDVTRKIAFQKSVLVAGFYL